MGLPHRGFKPGDKVEVTVGPDAGRRATVQTGYDKLYPGSKAKGARVGFDDGMPTRLPHHELGQTGAVRDYGHGVIKKVR